MHLQARQKKYLYEVLIIIALGTISFIILMSSPLNPLYKGASKIDSSVFKYVSMEMAEGGMPYKDTFDHKGPLLYLINYAGYLISYYRGVWVIEYFFMFVFLAVTYATARLFCGRVPSLLLVLLCASPFKTYFNGGNLSEEYALVFIAIGMYIFIDYFLNNQISKLRLVICGVCCAAVLMLRLNLAAIWIVFPVAVLIKCAQEKNRDWISFVLWFLAGMAVLLLPILIWLAVNGAFNDFINDYIIFNLKYSSSAAWSTILSRYKSFTYFLSDSLLLGACVINIFMIIKNEENRFFNSVYLIGIFFSLVAIAIAGTKYDHYGMAFMPLLIYPYAWLFGECHLKEIETSKWVLSFFLLTLVFSQWQKLGQNVFTGIQNYSVGEDAFTKEEKKVVDIICSNTSEDDRIIVIGNQDIWYVLSGRLAASKYSYQDPIVQVDETIREEFINDMEVNCPKLVVLTDDCRELFTRIDDYECIYENKDDTLSVYLLPSEE